MNLGINTDSHFIFSRIEGQIRAKRNRQITYRVAAIVLPVCIFLGAFFYINNQIGVIGKTEYASFYVPKGEKTRLFFQDGTEIFLNADTYIRYPKKFGLKSREIYLDGEAYFKVAKKAFRPFVVHLDKNSIKVLGTSFNVTAYKSDDKIDITLDDGKINFRTMQNSYTLQPGQKLQLDKASGQLLLKKVEKSTDESLWRYDVLKFDDTPLNDILLQLNRRFDIDFTVQTSKLLNYSFTLTTTQNSSLENILREFERIGPIRFVKTDSTYQVTLQKLH